MNIDLVRGEFPALSRKVHGQPVVYLDGPAGTQVPTRVIDAISGYYRRSNANSHGQFAASQETDDILHRTRTKVATFLGAESPNCISFGQNMTTLNFSLSKAILRNLSPGDEIFITQLDHESNRGPWLKLREHGMIVHEIKLLPSGVLNYSDFERRLSSKTKLVCIGYASNILGTVNDISRIVRTAKREGAMVLVDAVHYAPHFLIDVHKIDCDFLLCSAYKFYGPHIGLLYSRPGLLDSLDTDCLRTQAQMAPYKIETGTLNHAAIAGVEAALDFIASLGDGESLRNQFSESMQRLHRHEMLLAKNLVAGLQRIDGVEIYGPSMDAAQRTPTISFTMKNEPAAQVCAQLGHASIYAWDGHFYAVRATEILGLVECGGVTRMGMAVYNTEEEISKTIQAVEHISKMQ